MKTQIDNFTFFNADNMEIMKQYPDKYFDLAIVDPPYDFSITVTHYASQKKYGSNIQETRPNSGLKIGGNYENGLGDIPNELYFNELFRISKNQIIWGGNYFTQHLFPTMGWLCWYKTNGDTSYFSDFELAWTSFQQRTCIFKLVSPKKRIHPTQKPVELYAWIIQKIAKENDKILDTHLGSGSIALAIDKANKLDNMNLEFVGIELDTEYFNAALNRFKLAHLQQTLFTLW